MRNILLASLLILATTVDAQVDTAMYGYIDSTHFRPAELSPAFGGGEMRWKQYLEKTFNYPEEARKKGLQGTATVEFIIWKDRTLSDFRVLEPIDSALILEAIRIIKGGRWVPAVHIAKPVNYRMRQAIEFKLN